MCYFGEMIQIDFAWIFVLPVLGALFAFLIARIVQGILEMVL